MLCAWCDFRIVGCQQNLYWSRLYFLESTIAHSLSDFYVRTGQLHPHRPGNEVVSLNRVACNQEVDRIALLFLPSLLLGQNGNWDELFDSSSVQSWTPLEFQPLEVNLSIKNLRRLKHANIDECCGKIRVVHILLYWNCCQVYQTERLWILHNFKDQNLPIF